MHVLFTQCVNSFSKFIVCHYLLSLSFALAHISKNRTHYRNCNTKMVSNQYEKNSRKIENLSNAKKWLRFQFISYLGVCIRFITNFISLHFHHFSSSSSSVSFFFFCSVVVACMVYLSEYADPRPRYYFFPLLFLSCTVCLLRDYCMRKFNQQKKLIRA